MAKRVDPLKAKAAKQKKMAIGLSVILVAVVGFQGPKTLKMLSGPATVPDSVSAAALASAAPAAAAPGATPGNVAVAAGAPAAAGDAQPAVLADSDLPVEPGEGQLLSFEQFAAKDPFDQQVDPNAVAKAAAATTAKAATAADKPATATETPVGAPKGTVVPGSGKAAGTEPEAPAGAPADQPAVAATATTISLNGELAELAADGSFPVNDPVFLLVSVAKDGKSVEIGIAGGVYAGGDETITLKIGKPLTLQNTADGSRFELELLTVQGFAPPKPKR